MVRLLVVEDDAPLCKVLVEDLKLEGYEVEAATNGLDGLERARALKPDLIILDLMLPKMTGYDVCRTLRKEGVDAPIIMLTARGQESEKVVGLEVGADDYITKPYGPMELIARVRALLRRHKRVLDKVEKTQFADITINFLSMEATKNGQPIDLTKKEFQMLELLIRYRGEVISRERFLEEIWGYDEKLSTRAVDNRILSLRQKLFPENPEAYIVSVHGTGYKFLA